MEELAQRATDTFSAVPEKIKGKERKIATGLGWFSIGLGAAELLFPRQVARLVGSRNNHTALMRFYGLRELAAGVGILTNQTNPAPWLWARVAGDALDLASLGATLAGPANNGAATVFGIVNVAAVTALDVICAQRLTEEQQQHPAEPPRARIRQSIAIDKSPEELYNFWHNFENLPRFMRNVVSVENRGDRRTHWVARNPLGGNFEWDAEVVNDVPNTSIEWRSTGGDIENSGSVRFVNAPRGRGTFVNVDLQFSPPYGALGKMAKMFPAQQIRQDLRRFKMLMETGEIATIEGQPSGTRTAKIKFLQERSI